MIYFCSPLTDIAVNDKHQGEDDHGYPTNDGDHFLQLGRRVNFPWEGVEYAAWARERRFAAADKTNLWVHSWGGQEPARCSRGPTSQPTFGLTCRPASGCLGGRCTDRRLNRSPHLYCGTVCVRWWLQVPHCCLHRWRTPLVSLASVKQSFIFRCLNQTEWLTVFCLWTQGRVHNWGTCNRLGAQHGTSPRCDDEKQNHPCWEENWKMEKSVHFAAKNSL